MTRDIVPWAPQQCSREQAGAVATMLRASGWRAEQAWQQRCAMQQAAMACTSQCRRTADLERRRCCQSAAWRAWRPCALQLPALLRTPIIMPRPPSLRPSQACLDPSRSAKHGEPSLAFCATNHSRVPTLGRSPPRSASSDLTSVQNSLYDIWPSPSLSI